MWLLILLILVMPLEKNPYLYISANFLGLFPDFTFIKALGLVGVVLVSFKVLVGQTTVGLLRSPQAKAFFLFVAFVLLSGLLNGAVMRPLTRLVSVVVLMPVVLGLVRDRGSLKSVLTAAPLSLILIFPYGYRNSLRFGGRLGMGLSEPNYFALTLVMILPLAFVFARHVEAGNQKRFWQVGTIVLVIATLLTGSRGGFIGLMAVTFFFVVKLAKRRVVAAITVPCAVLLLLAVVPNPLLDRLRASGLDADAYDTGVESSNRTRLAELEGGLRMIAARPLTGVGLGNFEEWMGRYGLIEKAMAHNTYVQIGAELGLPALFAFLLVMTCGYRSLGRSARMAAQNEDPFFRDAALAVQVGLMGYMAAGTFVSAHFEKYLWLVLFLTIAMERVIRKEGVAAEVAADTLPRPERRRPAAAHAKAR